MSCLVWMTTLTFQLASTDVPTLKEENAHCFTVKANVDNYQEMSVHRTALIMF